MARKFNTAGPSVSRKHYMIDPLERINLKQIEELIADESYFLLHAPRQSGKTTTLMALMQYLNQQGTYKACYVNIQRAQTAREDVGRGMQTVCGAITRAARRYLGDERLKDWTKEALELEGVDGVLTGLLERWSEGTESPIVLMLDEVDTLVGDTLIAVLGQIRSGYAQRPDGFPQAIILCGVRDLSDYRIRTAHKEIITGGSPFNIKAASLRLGNFSREETEALWRQHQEETGQPIEPAIYPELWEDTRGQPWLVNSLGDEVTRNDRAVRDRSKTITLESYFAGRERLIRSRVTHIDQLAHKLREERVRPIISDILEGSTAARNYPSEDLAYVADLGLIVTEPQIRIANRIYQEVIPRELMSSTLLGLQQQTAWYVKADGRLDLPKLFVEFRQYFRENADSSMHGEVYREVVAQLLLHIFLLRIVNGGGRVDRESASGSGRVDLSVRWPLYRDQLFHGPVQKAVIEIKVVRSHDGLDTVVAKGIAQAAGYADTLGAEETYVVVFDQRPNKTWAERSWQRMENYVGRAIGVWGM